MNMVTQLNQQKKSSYTQAIISGEIASKIFLKYTGLSITIDFIGCIPVSGLWELG